MIEWFLGKPGNCSCFTPIERAVLFAIGKLLDEPFAATYREQLSLPNEVQRLANGKECNFYIKRLFQLKEWPENLALPKIAREYLLGIVTLQHRDSKAEARARVYVVDGHVFSVTFDRSPGFLNQNFKVTEAILVNNPDAKAILSPLPEGTVLPAEYLELLKKKQSKINGWDIVPENEIREVVQEGNNLYVIAENEQLGVMCVRGGGKSGTPIYVNFEDMREVELDGSFADFLMSTAADYT